MLRVFITMLNMHQQPTELSPFFFFTVISFSTLSQCQKNSLTDDANQCIYISTFNKKSPEHCNKVGYQSLAKKQVCQNTTQQPILDHFNFNISKHEKKLIIKVFLVLINLKYQFGLNCYIGPLLIQKTYHHDDFASQCK